MTVEEVLKYREFKLNAIKDESGFYSEEEFAQECLYFLNSSKLTDSDDFNECFFQSTSKEQIKLNGYLFNESGERLQLFIVNLPILEKDNPIVSRKDYYDSFFAKGINFIKQAIAGGLASIHDTEPVKPLIHALKDAVVLSSIDVVEIFLLTSTLSIENRGGIQQLKNFDFEDEEVAVKYQLHSEQEAKKWTIKKRVIDLNFLYRLETAKTPREPLEINFIKYGETLECLSAAKENDYESFITIIHGVTLQKLYHDYSSRLLERNVRAFLQFKKGANQNMRATIKTAPEKFLAFNNGLTITASDAVLRDVDGKLVIESLSDFQIVNGGQTTASIYFTAKDGTPLDKVKVFAKINVIKDKSPDELEDLIKAISINSNTQTKVTTVDLDSRSPFLRKIKEISESVIPPDGKRWFFERAKGEYFTKLNTSTSVKQIQRDYPKDRVLTKEQLAKYFVAWGDRPHLVKKGGEKVFKDFMLILKETYRNPDQLSAVFFEDLVSKIILFRELEILYGVRSTAIGHIRSATVPYSVSLIFLDTQGSGQVNGLSYFNLCEIWKNQKLSTDLKEFGISLLRLVNTRIVANKFTDDVNEDTKKEEMWKRIKTDTEIINFFNATATRNILKKYLLSEKQYEERYGDLNNHLPAVASITAETWFKLSNWAKENGKFEGQDRRFLFQMGKLVSQSRKISDKQAKWARDLYEKSVTDGFDVTELGES